MSIETPDDRESADMAPYCWVSSQSARFITNVVQPRLQRCNGKALQLAKFATKVYKEPMCAARKTSETTKLWERLLALLDERGLSINAFGQQIKTSATAMGKWRDGKAKPSLETRKRMALVLGVSLDDIIRLDGEESEIDDAAREEPRESRVVYDAAYPSLDEFLAGPMARGIKPEHEKELRGDRFAGGDPGVDYYVHRYNAILSRERHHMFAKEKPKDLTEGHPEYRKINWKKER